MKKLLASAVGAALSLTSTAGLAVTPTVQATATAHIYKPLQISFGQNLDFGTLVLNSGVWSGQVVKIDQAGAMTGCGANVTCSGSPVPAKYHLVGTNNAVVKITSLPFNLTGPGTLAFTPDAPATVNLGASGLSNGVDFFIGGSITLDSTTPDGVYSGTFVVTADYQ
jgi:hypothetical protein